MKARELAELLMQTPDAEVVLSDDLGDHFRPVTQLEDVEVYHEPGYPEYMEDYKKHDHWLTRKVKVLRSW